MTRSTIKNPIKPFEEPEREMHKKRRVARLQQQNESLSITGHNLFDEGPSFFPNQILRPRDFECIPPLTHPALCTENPIHHIKHFLSIVHHIQADRATRDASRLHFFHFTLKGKAKEWLEKLPPGTITSWEQIVSKFLDKLFPAERTARIRDKILQFYQFDNKSIKGAWKRFQDLLHQAPPHGIKKWLLFSSLNKDEGWDRIEELIQYQDDSWDESAHEDDECDQVESREQACLSGGDIYDDPYLLKFYQNNDIPSWGILIRKREEEEGPNWVVRS
ncbi:zinc finger, CCHC-type containing protein [Tanacetum coccineum]